jgi:DNA-binding MarR family transcriptional regulator
MTRPPLAFDPIEEARQHWSDRWEGGSAMAAATALVRASQLVVATVDEALRPFDLNFPRFEALVLLVFSRDGALPLGKMGERLLIHPASVTNIVDRLEAQGFVTRTPHPTDRRTILALITDEGRRVVEEATQAVVASAFSLEGLSEREIDQLTRTLRKLRLLHGDFTQAGDRPQEDGRRAAR